MPEEIRFYIREAPYGFLSNFWRNIQYHQDIMGSNLSYPTNEHYYQSQKAKDSKIREWIRTAPSAWLAMKAGRSLQEKDMVSDWETRRIAVMLDGLKDKFLRNDTLKYLLLWTGDAILIENSPTDMFWGGALPGSQNTLGKLLMQVREEIRKNE